MGRKVEETRGTGYVETPLVVSMAATSSSSSSSFSCFTRGVKIKEGEREEEKEAREKGTRVGVGGEADVINGNCAKVPRRTRVTPVPH